MIHWRTINPSNPQQPIQHLQLADQLFQAQNFVRLVKLGTSTVETCWNQCFQRPNLGGVLQIVWICSIVHFRECDGMWYHYVSLKKASNDVVQKILLGYSIFENEDPTFIIEIFCAGNPMGFGFSDFKCTDFPGIVKLVQLVQQCLHVSYL